MFYALTRKGQKVNVKPIRIRKGMRTCMALNNLTEQQQQDNDNQLWSLHLPDSISLHQTARILYSLTVITRPWKILNANSKEIEILVWCKQKEGDAMTSAACSHPGGAGFLLGPIGSQSRFVGMLSADICLAQASKSQIFMQQTTGGRAPILGKFNMTLTRAPIIEHFNMTRPWGESAYPPSSIWRRNTWRGVRLLSIPLSCHASRTLKKDMTNKHDARRRDIQFQKDMGCGDPTGGYLNQEKKPSGH